MTVEEWNERNQTEHRKSFWPQGRMIRERVWKRAYVCVDARVRRAEVGYPGAR
jgi:hypothetical protein